MNHGRFHWFEPKELDTEQAAVYENIVGGPRARDRKTNSVADDLGRLRGPFNAMLIHPGVGDAVQNLGAAIRYKTSLTGRAREIAILVVSRKEVSNFEWYAHASLALAAGVTDEELVALADDRAAETFDENEQLVWRITQSLTMTRDLDDALFAEGVDVLGEVLVMDLIYLVGFYELIARSLRVGRVPLPDGETPQFD